MGFFDSNSESSTMGAETGQQTSGDSKAFSLSNIKTGDGADSIHITTTDHGLVAGALDGLDKVIDLSEVSQDRAFQFGGAALDEVGMANDRAFQFGGAALDEVGITTDRAFQFGGAALDEVKAAQDRAFSYAAATNKAAQAQNAKALQEIAKSGDRALQYGAGVTQEAFSQISASNRSALETAGDAFGASMSFINDAFGRSMDSVEAAGRNQEGAFTMALDAIQESSDSEVKRVSEQMLWVLAGVIALATWRATQ